MVHIKNVHVRQNVQEKSTCGYVSANQSHWPTHTHTHMYIYTHRQTNKHTHTHTHTDGPAIDDEAADERRAEDDGQRSQ